MHIYLINVMKGFTQTLNNLDQIKFVYLEPSKSHVHFFSPISQNIYKKMTFFFFLFAVLTSRHKMTKCCFHPSRQSGSFRKSSWKKFVCSDHLKQLTVIPHFFWVLFKKNSSLHAFSSNGSQELVCLMRGSDIFALQEVQLQHPPNPPDAWLVWSSHLSSSETRMTPTAVPNNTKPLWSPNWKQS